MVEQESQDIESVAEHAVSDRPSAGAARSLRLFWWLILLSVVIGGAIGFAVSLLLEPKYGATAQVAYSQLDAAAVTKALTDAGTAGLPKAITNDALVLGTTAFADRVAQVLGGAVDAASLRSSLDVSVAEDVEVVRIWASAAQADLAARVANACADEFVEVRQEEIQGLLREALQFLRGRLASLTPSERAGSVGLALEQYEYALDSLLDRSISDYEVLERAEPPSSPYYPRPLVYLVIGLGVGLVVGLALAVIVGRRKARRDRTTVERALDLPTVGVVPLATSRRSGRRSNVGFHTDSVQLLESMRTLRANLKVLGFGETKRTLLITSPTDGEEKNALAVDLALCMALCGDRVILVDADLRSPSIHEYLGVSNARGLEDVLTDAGVEWSEAIQPIDLVPFVDQSLLSSPGAGDGERSVTKFLCLVAGSGTTDDLSAALGSGTLSGLLSELQGYSDYVIVAGPPASSVSDALILARAVDAVVIASPLGNQRTAEIRRVRQLFARAEVEPLGVVFCGTRVRPI